MRKRIHIGLVILFVAAVGAISWRGFTSREPSYQGLPLSAWMQDMQWQNGWITPSVREALRHMSREALPRIIRDLKSRDSSLQYRILKWASDHHLTKTVPPPASIRNRRATMACMVIGPDAKPAIVALANLLNERPAHDFASALARIGGPEAVSALIDLGTRPNATAEVRMNVAWVLGQCPSNAPLVVPALLRCLQDSNSIVRSDAASSLGNLREEPAVAVPALISALSDSDVHVRWNTCLALAKFTNQAQTAVVPLLGILNSQDALGRTSAAIALAHIDSQNPTTVAKAMPFLVEAITGHGVDKTADQRAFEYLAIQALGDCGSLARSAVPTLLNSLQQADLQQRDFVVKAVQSIDPQIKIPPEVPH